MATYGAAIAGGVMNTFNTMLGNYMAQERENVARSENYRYGEMSAINADARTRALYNDLQSPEAIMRQLKKAGLSPSLMYGGNMGGSVGQGAQGNGASGISPTTFGIPAMDLAQLGLIEAQTQNVKAQTANTNQDTIIKGIEANLKQLEASEYENTWHIVNSTWTIDGKETSIFEIARNCLTYEEFMHKLRDNESTDTEIKRALTTEKGQEAARSVYIAASQFHKDIMVLSAESVNANFESQIAQELIDANFAKLNANAAVQELKKSISTDELDARQKDAWNNLLNRLEKTNPTMHDIVVILGMIVNNALTNYRLPKVTKVSNVHNTNLY